MIKSIPAKNNNDAYPLFLKNGYRDNPHHPSSFPYSKKIGMILFNKYHYIALIKRPEPKTQTAEQIETNEMIKNKK